MKKLLAALMLFTFAGSEALAIRVRDLTTSRVEDLATFLAGRGVVIYNVQLNGHRTSAGFFEDGFASGLGFNTGMLLSTGSVLDAVGPNNSQSTSTNLRRPGDAELDAVVAPLRTFDATVLEFDFITVSPDFTIRYVFASEEYQEFVNSAYNDVFTFSVDGRNIALVPQTGEPVTINSINHLVNTAEYRDNPPGTGRFDLAYDGFTTVLVAETTVTPNEPHHIRIAIADTSDEILDAAVFLEEKGISGFSSIVLDPREVVASSTSDPVELTVNVNEVPEGATMQLVATGLPEGASATFAQAVFTKPGSTKLSVVLGPNARSKSYRVVVEGIGAGIGDTRAAALIHFECVPPFILGTNDSQPQTQRVARGSSATLRVAPGGSPRHTYQWYEGPVGSTYFPIPGANGPAFVTPRLQTPAAYWVRVSNGCGSVDSNAAYVFVD